MAMMLIMHDSHACVRSSVALCVDRRGLKGELNANQKDFDNKRVVVVGGSSGVGLAVAEKAALQGVEVIIVSSSAGRVQEAIQSIEGNVRGEVVDVSDEKAVEGFFTNLGAFDHLVFTAGDSLQLHELADTDLKQARSAFELRYWFYCRGKYGSPQIRKGGSIVLTTGVAGRRPHSGWVVVASVCGTIEALTRALAVELAPIRVNAVSPGVVRTNLWQNMSSSEREQLFESVGKRCLGARG